jgi:RNA 2',3'-cyclic 3'-phosphodiesterase
VRLFVAIHPDPAARVWLGKTEARLREALGRNERELRWVEPGMVHVTLAFLGELPGAEPVIEQLKGCHFPPMELAVGGLGVFFTERRPSVLWAGCREPSGALVRMQAEISQALSPLVEPERRPFAAHLTLARIRRGARWRGDMEKLSVLIGFAPMPWRVEKFTLMQSYLEKSGPRYTVVRSFR